MGFTLTKGYLSKRHHSNLFTLAIFLFNSVDNSKHLFPFNTDAAPQFLLKLTPSSIYFKIYLASMIDYYYLALIVPFKNTRTQIMNAVSLLSTINTWTITTDL